MAPALDERAGARRMPTPLPALALSDVSFGPVVMADDPCEAALTGADPVGPRKYYRARYYDPGLGRFLSEDPIGPEAAGNPYHYAENNPQAWVDPFGLQANPPGWGWFWNMSWRWRWNAGPSQYYFGPGTGPAQAMMSAYGVQAAMRIFCQKNVPGLWNQSVTNAGKVGSFTVNITPINNTSAQVVLTNTTSFKSLWYGVAPAWNRHCYLPVGGNMSQTYFWNINPASACGC